MSSTHLIPFILHSILLAICIILITYLVLLCLLIHPFFQSHIVYLHAIKRTWFSDLSKPEQFGFLPGQVSTFYLPTPDGEKLFTWLILPVEQYFAHETELTNPLRVSSAEKSNTTTRFDESVAVRLLRSDSAARVVVHLHGAAGTVASGERVRNYTALLAGGRGRVYVVAFDYRGFGNSTGSPTQSGLVIDATTVVEWVVNTLGVSRDRIVLFGQSLGTAVCLATLRHLALRNEDGRGRNEDGEGRDEDGKRAHVKGIVLVAPFTDIAALVSTYRIARTVPILGPVAGIKPLFEYFQTFITDQWLSKDHVEEYIRWSEEKDVKYRITMIHAEDDADIPWHHTSRLFWHAVNASTEGGITYAKLDDKRKKEKIDMGPGGSVMEWRTKNGIIREEVTKSGSHDIIMGFPVVSLAIMRIFDDNAPSTKT